MHFDFLIEDLSGKEMLSILLPNIIIAPNTYKVKHYGGIGHLPKNLKKLPDPKTRGLLNKLPMLIKGFGETYQNYGTNYQAILMIVIDLDSKNKNDFLKELNEVLTLCNPQPTMHFCLAIEEGEAWFLGDINAIQIAYPSAKINILNTYTPDSICGTWELLANAIYKGGIIELKKKGSPTVGKEKSAWAMNITPYMEIDNNTSPSFCYFRDKIKEYINNRYLAKLHKLKFTSTSKVLTLRDFKYQWIEFCKKSNK